VVEGPGHAPDATLHSAAAPSSDPVARIITSPPRPENATVHTSLECPYDRRGFPGESLQPTQKSAGMHPLVRDLYKRVVSVGRDYPSGLAEVRRIAKDKFRKHKDLADLDAIKRAVHYGRYLLKEMIGVVQLKKFRTLKRRYDHDDDDRREPPSSSAPR